jgi:putative membrane protein
MKRIGIAAAILGLAMTAACNKDNRSTTANNSAVGTSGKAAGSMSNGDRDLVRDVAAMNTADLDLGKLASERGASADVKQFAQMMVTDHTAAATRLQAFQTEHGIDVPPDLDGHHRDVREKLANKQGAEFDRAYADAMVDEHQALADKLESRIDKDTLSRTKVDNSHGPDASVKATAVLPQKSDDPNTLAVNQWAAELYPVVYAHLQAAKALRDGVKSR